MEEYKMRKDSSRNNTQSNSLHNTRSNNLQSNAQRRAQQVVDEYVTHAQLRTDPQGSWTGKPRNANEVPVQDADDL